LTSVPATVVALALGFRAGLGSLSGVMTGHEAAWVGLSSRELFTRHWYHRIKFTTAVKAL
jgi:hypothetical protein